MRQLTFDMDYTYCPKGHGDWIHMPSSTLYPDVFWCDKCDCFYEPSVRPLKKGKIDEDYTVGREDQLKKMAKFISWREGLSFKDMPIENI